MAATLPVWFNHGPLAALGRAVRCGKREHLPGLVTGRRSRHELRLRVDVTTHWPKVSSAQITAALLATDEGVRGLGPG